MELSTDLHCLFTAEVSSTDNDDSYVVTVPEREIAKGAIDPGHQYRIAILPADPDAGPTTTQTETAANSAGASEREQAPPVSEGETHNVEIESLGDQGDGIAKIERGFVVIVPDTDVGERVTVEITDVGPNVAFANVIGRHHAV